MLLGRAMHEMAALPDGRILVPGGLNAHYYGATAPVAEVYDPTTDRWSVTAPMVSYHSKHSVTTLRDGRVLVAGGEGRLASGRAGDLTVSEVFDPVANTWTATGPMTTAIPYNHSASLLSDGRVLVAGGARAGQPGAAGALADAQLYDPTTNSWGAAGPMHQARSYHSFAVLADGRVLVAGGYGTSGLSLATAEVYDPATDSWTETAPMARPHHNETNAAVVVADGSVVIAGGSARTADAAELAADVQRFDPASKTWRLLPPLHLGRNDHNVVGLRDGRILVAGGQVFVPGAPLGTATPLATEATTQVELYDPVSGASTVLPQMHVARANSAAIALPDGSVLLTGGLHLPSDGAYVADRRVERFNYPRPSTATARARADRPDAQPVGDAPIQPGAAVCAVDDIVSELSELPPCDKQGTLNFVFRDDSGGLYVGTAAHVFPDGMHQAFVPSCTTCNGLQTKPFGRVVFSSDSVDVGHPDDLPEPDLLDFALIKIRPAWHHLVEPRVRHWGGPVGVIVVPEASPTDAAAAYGNGEGKTPGPRGPGQIIAASRTAFSTTVPEVGGDSGMPYLHGRSGKALGVNANCPCGATGFYPTLEHVLERLAANGFHLTLVTGAPAPPLATLMST